MNKIPKYEEGWKPVLDVMRKGKFFVSTGEVLFPSFSINGKTAGETLKLENSVKTNMKIKLNWTYPMNFAEIITGDGTRVFRERINLTETQAFGQKEFTWPVDLTHKKWVRVEAWDVADNGAFTQMIWLE